MVFNKRYSKNSIFLIKKEQQSILKFTGKLYEYFPVNSSMDKVYHASVVLCSASTNTNSYFFFLSLYYTHRTNQNMVYCVFVIIISNHFDYFHINK